MCCQASCATCLEAPGVPSEAHGWREGGATDHYHWPGKANPHSASATRVLRRAKSVCVLRKSGRGVGTPSESGKRAAQNPGITRYNAGLRDTMPTTWVPLGWALPSWPSRRRGGRRAARSVCVDVACRCLFLREHPRNKDALDMISLTMNGVQKRRLR